MSILSSHYQVLLFLCDLELLHIKLTPDDFQTINKIGVIHQLLKNHSHEPKVKNIVILIFADLNFHGFKFYSIQAMWLVAEICRYYEITDIQPWAALLKQMHTLGMVSVWNL